MRKKKKKGNKKDFESRMELASLLEKMFEEGIIDGVIFNCKIPLGKLEITQSNGKPFKKAVIVRNVFI